jgi:hypothetical protein
MPKATQATMQYQMPDFAPWAETDQLCSAGRCSPLSANCFVSRGVTNDAQISMQPGWPLLGDPITA